ncbi:aromatic ring-hydroxylating oxygenase subunit alpha [Mucilaginibacter ginsenosidivorans]|uniref:Aromatic ring-hydroxylating dioxygenase subunit alpha n=1 Tax=Mucilaginibacter ginsenosidivorans TaxID=398053 RepID=A0A5B8V1G7_9SPHI|nr:aromatic ring-hydroxylating dioxygenase subunit alpha [Mucilaginibacter ginsenosidivorans]QEC64406.1 aromatic ring-hydroxylating dioxygenase subunit alpha [Mucilaginibacter ginsenosidivorans]
MPDFSVDPDIAKAKTIDAEFYTSKYVFEQCREKIFATSWQFIGHQELVKEPGDVYPFTLLSGYLDEPLLLTKDKTGQSNVLSNVCTHRGNIVAEKACKLNNLRCRYHGRLFGLDGKFVSMPEFKEVENFPSKDDDLPALPLFKWSNWLFTSLNPVYPPELFFRDMIERVSWMPLHQFRFQPELSRTFNVKGNWALYCENYLEGFHIPFVHAGLNAVIDFGEYATELFFPYSSLQLGLARNNENCFDLPASSPDYGKNVAAYYFWVFPNMMFNFYPWGLSVNVVEPVSVGECRVRFLSYVWDETKLEKGAGSGLDKVEMEDEEIVENVQRGVRSRFYQHGRYSVTREQGTHHFHRILAEFINK